jgi:transposase
VTSAEVRRIQELFVRGVRIGEIVRRVGRSESVVYRAVVGLKRRRPHPPVRNEARDAKIVALAAKQRTLEEIAQRFGLTKTRVCQIIRLARGFIAKKRPKSANVVPSPLPPSRPFEKRAQSREQHMARDRLIVRLAAQGVQLQRLATRFGISRQRVHQIVNAAAQARRPQRAG